MKKLDKYLKQTSEIKDTINKSETNLVRLVKDNEEKLINEVNY